INKYGIVPESVMPDVELSKNSLQLIRILRDKVKKDIFKLLELKKNNKTKDELYNEKEKMLSENYNILSKCLGELPIKFDYEYKDKNGKCIKISGITPIEFTNKYLTINLNNLVGIANVPMYNKEYNKLYKKKHAENVFENSDVEFINMPINILKELSIKHLKDGIPVYFGCDMKKMRENDLGIMDSTLYNYKEVFNIDLLTKEEALSMHDIDYQHVMLITGVHIENDKTIRWKIEDSYGDKVHKDGYYIMNDNFFDDFVIEVMIDKKYLSKQQLELFNQKPILFEMNEPF
ncbi:MAG: aminopeptidase, partial [Bacilli bacterium]|nr:aminopeptidase [Bacilli bacterium]